MRRRLYETPAGRPRRGGDRRSRAARPPGRRPACLGRPPAHRRPAVSRRPTHVAVVDREHAAPRATLACLARRRRRSRAPPRRRVLPFRLPHGEGLLTLAKLTFLTPAGALVVLGVALP